MPDAAPFDWTRYPDFASCRAEDLNPAVDVVLAEAEAVVAALEADVPETWSGLMGPLEAVGDRIHKVSVILWQVTALCAPEGWPEAAAQAHPKLAAFVDRMGQSAPLVAGMAALLERGGDQLSSARRRILEGSLLAARLQGVDQPPPVQARLTEISERLSVLSSQFSSNVLAWGQSWSMRLDTPAQVEGLPVSWRSMAAAQSAQRGRSDATADAGPWTVTLDYPLMIPVLQHARDRALREAVRRAYGRKASDGAHDNTELVREILALRAERAELLGFGSYAELALTQRMADSVEEVRELMTRLLEPACAKGLGELAHQTRLAEAAGHPTPLEVWDVTFWRERHREEKTGISDEELRPYLEFEHVLATLTDLLGRLFGVTLTEAPLPVPSWAEGVRFFEVRDEGNDAIVAEFFLDPFARPGQKQGGAWMMPLLGRSAALAPADAPMRLPVALLACNQTPATPELPSLMSLREVHTLFHEMGHGLQHMLTEVDDLEVSGIGGIEWDAVELPSMFLERWVDHRPVLTALTRHYQTGAHLPSGVIDRILAARTFGAGAQITAGVKMVLQDLALHDGAHTSEDPFAVWERLSRDIGPLPPLPSDRFMCSFRHIFAGGYAAGYYSYLWADVLAADAFSAFVDAAEADWPEIGRRFRRTVLGLGGSQHPAEVFQAFRGRGVQVDALLREKGLLEEVAAR